MKTSAAAISAVLVLLLAGAAHAQPQAPPMRPDPQGGVDGPAVRRPPVARPRFPVKRPSFVRAGFFGRHPFFFRSGLVVPSPVVAVTSTYVYTYPTPVYIPYPAYGQSQPQYWAYCRSAQGYYPYVPECPGGWLPVLPTSTPPPQRASDNAERELRQAPEGGMPVEEIRERIARSRAD
jgi:hypothetical protein